MLKTHSLKSVERFSQVIGFYCCCGCLLLSWFLHAWEISSKLSFHCQWIQSGSFIMKKMWFTSELSMNLPDSTIVLLCFSIWYLLLQSCQELYFNIKTCIYALLSAPYSSPWISRIKFSSQATHILHDLRIPPNQKTCPPRQQS